jgi:4'-phosphopantetheinyl transferase
MSSTPSGKPLIALANNDIHLWITFPEAIRDSLLLARYDQLMTTEEREKQCRYVFERDRHDALVTRALVRTVLSRYLPVAPEHWRFAKGENGKPEIIDAPWPLRFNVSHTRGMIICGVTRQYDLGVDIEHIHRDTDVTQIADRFFSPSEVTEMFSLPLSDQRSRFFDYWTLKESYIKAWGQGLAIPLDHFSFHINDSSRIGATNRDIRMSFVPQRNDNPADWQSWLLYPNASHRMAVSLRGAGIIGHELKLFQCVPMLQEWEVELPVAVPPMEAGPKKR